MFDLSERKISFPANTTPPKIGPSTYFLEVDKRVKENYVPFLNSTCRCKQKTLYSKANTDALYNADVKQRIKGGSSMASKAPRFKEVEDDGLPGPDHYDPKRPGKRIVREIVGKGRVYNCRVPYSVHAKGLSIPTRLDENGYWIDEYNTLVKIPATKHDHSLGPAYYDLSKTKCYKCYNCEKYKGCRWSLSGSKRIEKLNIENTPGPGTYYPERRIRCTMNNPMDIEYRAFARQFSFMPRFAEAQQMLAKKQNFPAPCDYNPNISTFQWKPSASIKPRPFLNATPRFGGSTRAKKSKQINDDSTVEDKYNRGPVGPGSYEVLHADMDKKTFSLMRAPFGTLAARRSFSTHKLTPGPATYNVIGPITSKLLRQKYRENPHVPFNKTAERNLSKINKDFYYMPSPADYIVEPLWKQKGSADSWQFRSTSKKGISMLKNTGDACAAFYNVSKPFKDNTNRRSHYRGCAPFQQSRNRGPLFPPKLGPGPGDYITEISLGGGGYPLNTTPRFREENETVGPATYRIHPKIDSSVYKANATNNLRLKEFVLNQKLRLPPQETFARWCNNLKKRRNLRWFYEYEMSLPKVKDYIKEELDETEYK